MDGKGIPRGYICRCTSPQDSGTFCEERNFCYSNPCMNGGICTNTLNGYTCKCSALWSGFNCNHPVDLVSLDSCLAETKRCINGGSCLKGPGEYFYSCKCPPNYSGASCEVYDVCATRPCLNNGACIFKPPSFFECNCTQDYIGLNCEKFNPCKNVTCANGGTCRINFNNNDFFCQCEEILWEKIATNVNLNLLA